MTYYIGQTLGLIGAGCSLVLPLLKKKSHMLAMAMATNGLAALNLLLIGQFGSAAIIHFLAVIQALVTLLSVRKESVITRTESIIFLFLYVACGLLGYTRPLDLIPIVGSLFNMLATFQRDVQKTRTLILINVSFFLVYYVIVGSSSAFMVLSTIITTTIAMYRHKKRH